MSKTEIKERQRTLSIINRETYLPCGKMLINMHHIYFLHLKVCEICREDAKIEKDKKSTLVTLLAESDLSKKQRRTSKKLQLEVIKD